MVIRKMKIEDYDNVYDLWMSCVGMGLNNLDDSEDVVIYTIQRFVLIIEGWELRGNWLIRQ